MRNGIICLALGAIFLLGLITITAQSAVAMHMQAFMNSTELQETGFKALTPRQQVAWDKWLVRYTGIILKTVGTLQTA